MNAEQKQICFLLSKKPQPQTFSQARVKYLAAILEAQLAAQEAEEEENEYGDGEA